jgi:Tol biopolymer transport system component
VKRTSKVCTGLLLAASLLAAPSANAAFPGANGDIAFSRFTREQIDIWVVAPDSTGTQRLTNTPRANEGMPDWNATGTQLAFSKCGRGKFSNCEIWTMNADGSDPTRLTQTLDAQETWPTWSPDGTQIAYTSNASDAFQDIWVMNSDGSGQTQLTTTIGIFDAFPEWSPDGTQIAFTSDRMDFDDIWLMDTDGTDPVRLTSGPKIDERPDWSPDGTRIAFSRSGNIFTMDSDGTDVTRLTSRSDRCITSVTWPRSWTTSACSGSTPRT